MYACTPCDVVRQGRAWNKEAQAALQRERDRRGSCGPNGFWGEDHPRGNRVVMDKHSAVGTAAQCGCVFDICVENNYQLPLGGTLPGVHARAWHQGNYVKGQDGNGGQVEWDLGGTST